EERGFFCLCFYVRFELNKVHSLYFSLLQFGVCPLSCFSYNLGFDYLTDC
ncbi:unnamed protein product, partial [Prunus brigantina]